MKHPRVKASAQEWTRLRELKLGPCRVCGATDTTLHHLVPRSLGGGDVADNLVSLCGDGVRGCHGRVENRDLSFCKVLRWSLTTDEVAYVRAHKSDAFLDRYYPVAA